MNNIVNDLRKSIAHKNFIKLHQPENLLRWEWEARGSNRIAAVPIKKSGYNILSKNELRMRGAAATSGSLGALYLGSICSYNHLPEYGFILYVISFISMFYLLYLTFSIIRQGMKEEILSIEIPWKSRMGAIGQQQDMLTIQNGLNILKIGAINPHESPETRNEYVVQYDTFFKDVEKLKSFEKIYDKETNQSFSDFSSLYHKSSMMTEFKEIANKERAESNSSLNSINLNSVEAYSSNTDKDVVSNESVVLTSTSTSKQGLTAPKGMTQFFETLSTEYPEANIFIRLSKRWDELSTADQHSMVTIYEQLETAWNAVQRAQLLESQSEHQQLGQQLRDVLERMITMPSKTAEQIENSINQNQINQLLVAESVLQQKFHKDNSLNIDSKDHASSKKNENLHLE